MARRRERFLAVWTLAALIAGVGVVTARVGDEREQRTAVATGDSALEGWAPGTTSSTEAATTVVTAPAPSTTAPPTTRAPRSTTATTARQATAAPTGGAGVPMPPGPFTPRVLPAGYVPRVDDGWVIRMPEQPQVSDPITRVEGRPFTFQGRVTDESGNLLSGICVKVNHAGFGQVTTADDGVFRLVGDPTAEAIPPMGVWVDIWDCTPGSDPGYYSLRSGLALLTPGDTSTWFFRLMQASRLEGVVVDEVTGAPVAGMCVEAEAGGVPGWDDRSIRSAPTGADGRFSLSRIAPWDTFVQAVACGADGWNGIQDRLPFRNGTTLTAVLLAAPPLVFPSS